MPHSFHSIAVCGAGTMGSGIAQVTAMYGFPTIIFDINPAMLEKAKAGISAQLTTLADKGKISTADAENIHSRIRYISSIEGCQADLVIEAVAEIPAVKAELFQILTAVNPPTTVFASNTSSLSVTDIAKSTTAAERFCGLHFFNPAPVMKLVEIVKTKYTDAGIIDKLYAFTLDIHKTPVVCTDSPGFIVNRIARHFYLESLKLVEDGSVSIEELDALMESSGFRMGPFRLMDYIGNDINLAVTKSLYEAFDQTKRFEPSGIQIDKVSKGELGKKTGRGYYDYNI